MIYDYPGEIITWVFLCPNLVRKVRRMGAIMNQIGRISSQHHTIIKINVNKKSESETKKIR